jgi:hypothetical protein
MVRLRFNSRKRSGSGALFLPEKVENTEEISPSCFSFRVSGDASVARSRFGVPGHLPARKVGHLTHFGEISLFMMRCVMWQSVQQSNLEY